MLNSLISIGWRKGAAALVVLCCTGAFMSAFAQAANAPPRPAAKGQAAKNESAPKQAEARRPRSPDRPPPESGRPFIGPRTTQGLAADAIARSAAH